MMRALLMGGVIVLVAVLAWRLLDGRGAEHESNLPDLGRGTAAEAAAARPEGGSSSAPVGSRPVSAAPFVDEARTSEPAAATESPSTILCIVKTHDGRPAAGAIVAAFSAANSGWITPRARFAADEEGRVKVVDLPALLRYGDLRVVATVPGLVGAESPSILVTTATAAGLPRTMNLPPTVALRVTLRRTNGEPYETETDVRLSPDGEPPNPFDEGGFGSGIDRAPGPRRAGDRRTSTGIADFPYVACGAELRISAASSARYERRAATTWSAPEAPGPRAHVALTLGLQALVVSGRVVAGAGKPRARARILVQLREPATESGASIFGDADAMTVVGDDGRFEATFDRDPAAVTASATRVKMTDEFNESESVDAEVLHGPPDSAGRIDLGELVFAEAPTLVEGRVVDTNGDPVPDASIGFFKKNETNGLYERDWFRPAAFLRAGSDGAFVVRGVLPAEARLPAFVGADSDGYYLVEPAALPAIGAVTVRVARGGRVSGTFKEGRTADCAERFEIEVVADAAPSTSDVRRKCDVSALGFSAVGVPPGSAKVVVRFKGKDAPLLVVEAITVAAGADVADPRLKNLDLSAHFGALRITITDEAGAPVPGAGVAELAEGTWSWVERRADDKGVVTVPTAGSPARLIALAPGYAAADLGKPTADCVVALKRPIRCRVVLTLPPDVALPAAPFGLSASLQWGGPDDSMVEEGHGDVEALAPEPDSGAFGADRKLTLVVRAPGVYLLQPNLTVNTGDERFASPLNGSARVKVGPADKELRVELKMTAEEVEREIKDARVEFDAFLRK